MSLDGFARSPVLLGNKRNPQSLSHRRGNRLPSCRDATPAIFRTSRLRWQRLFRKIDGATRGLRRHLLGTRSSGRWPKMWRGFSDGDGVQIACIYPPCGRAGSLIIRHNGLPKSSPSDGRIPPGNGVFNSPLDPACTSSFGRAARRCSNCFLWKSEISKKWKTMP